MLVKHSLAVSFLSCSLMRRNWDSFHLHLVNPSVYLIMALAAAPSFRAFIFMSLNFSGTLFNGCLHLLQGNSYQSAGNGRSQQGSHSSPSENRTPCQWTLHPPPPGSPRHVPGIPSSPGPCRHLLSGSGHRPYGGPGIPPHSRPFSGKGRHRTASAGSKPMITSAPP